MAALNPALAFRHRLLEADAQFADAVTGIMATLRSGFGPSRPKRPRREANQRAVVARNRWVCDIPSFGALDGPHPDLYRSHLTLIETRACAGRFNVRSWHTPPPDDPAAEVTEPGVALVTNWLVVQPDALQFNVSLLALVSLRALADWFAAGEGVREAPALLADLASLASAAAGPSAAEAGAFTCPGDGGTWAGEVAPVPGPPVKRYDGAPPPTVVMIGQFAC